MKLARFGNPGAEKPGLIDVQGRLRDLSNVIADLTPANLSRSALQKLAAIVPSTLPLVGGEPRFGVPIAGVGKFIAIGLNYADHAAEAKVKDSKDERPSSPARHPASAVTWRVAWWPRVAASACGT
jgi:2,4-didehydro-3-deoxy-L-rhamnonate hydrolase